MSMTEETQMSGGLGSLWGKLLVTRVRGVGLKGVPMHSLYDRSQLSPFTVNEEKLRGRNDISGSLFIGEWVSPTCKTC